MRKEKKERKEKLIGKGQGVGESTKMNERIYPER